MPRMRLTLAELLDRFTIEWRKHFYGHGNEQLMMELDHEIYGQIANICVDRETANKMMCVVRCAARLGIHNADIANLEWQLRQREDFSLEEQGRRARVIRKINDQGRVGMKQMLSEQLQQNVETRHYGYGEDIKASDLTLDVQEPAEMGKPLSEILRSRSSRLPLTFADAVNIAIEDAKKLGTEVPFMFNDQKRIARPDGTYYTAPM